MVNSIQFGAKNYGGRHPKNTLLIAAELKWPDVLNIISLRQAKHNAKEIYKPWIMQFYNTFLLQNQSVA